MFEAQFTRLFEPYKDGFVVYPSYKKGGKFVTVAERDALLADFRRSFRPAALFGMAMLAAASGVVAFELERLLALSHKESWIGPMLAGLLANGWQFRIFSAPARRVRGRPDVVPPRSRAEWRQFQLKATAWWHIVVILMGSAGGLYFASTLPEGSIKRLFLFGCGCLMLVFGFVHAFRKWRHQPA